MQAYAYCGCYYTLPKSISDCANQQLQPQAPNTTTLLATSTALAVIPTSSENPISAETANKEPTSPYPIPSEDITSITNQGPFTTPDPKISTTPSNNPDPNKQLQLQSQPQAQSTTTLLATSTPPTNIPSNSEVPADAVNANNELTPPYLIPSEASIPATDQDPPTTSDPQNPATAPSNDPGPDTTMLSILNVEPSTRSTSAELPIITTIISTYTTTIYTKTITTAAITTSASTGTTTVYTCLRSDVTFPAVESTAPSAEPAAWNGSAVCAGCKRGRRSRIF